MEYIESPREYVEVSKKRETYRETKEIDRSINKCDCEAIIKRLDNIEEKVDRNHESIL